MYIYIVISFLFICSGSLVLLISQHVVSTWALPRMHDSWWCKNIHNKKYRSMNTYEWSNGVVMSSRSSPFRFLFPCEASNSILHDDAEVAETQKDSWQGSGAWHAWKTEWMSDNSTSDNLTTVSTVQSTDNLPTTINGPWVHGHPISQHAMANRSIVACLTCSTND